MMTHRCEHNEIDIAVFELNPNYDHQYGNEIFSSKKIAKFFFMIKYNFSTIQYRTQSY